MGDNGQDGIDKELPNLKQKIWVNRNLVFIFLIWIVIAFQSYYEYQSVWEHYNWAIGVDDMIGRASEERIQRDTIVEPGKISIGLTGTMWGLFFTGYFLNSHAKVMKKD